MDIIDELIAVKKERGFSADTMSKFIGCSSRQVERWIKGDARPTLVYQKLIRNGIRRVKKL